MAEIQSKFGVVNNADVQLIVERYLDAKYFTISDFFVKALGENTSGFISDHAILSVNVNVNGLDEVYTFFLKISSEELAVHAQYIEDIGAFKKETQLFNGLIPLLQKCSSKQWSPKCLYSRKDLLVFENLSQLGFFNCEHKKKTILDLEHCLEAAKALARLHSASIILESKPVFSAKPYNIYKEFGDILKENTYVSDVKSPRKKWLDVSIRATLALMRLIPELKTPEKLAKINEQLPKIFLDLPNVVKASSKFRNVMGHGDIWANNMMFKYENGKPIDCRLVDFQFSRYAPASWDLMGMLHLTTTREFRDNYMQKVVDAYYNVVNEELRNHNLDVNILMPYDELLTANKYFSRPALVETIIFDHTIILPDYLATHVVQSTGGYAGFVLGDREAILYKAWNNDEHFREIMTDRLMELAEKYIL